MAIDKSSDDYKAFDHYLQTLPKGAQQNIRDAMERGESLSWDIWKAASGRAFSHALADTIVGAQYGLFLNPHDGRAKPIELELSAHVAARGNVEVFLQPKQEDIQAIAEWEVVRVLRSLEHHSWLSDCGGYALDSDSVADVIRQLAALQFGKLPSYKPKAKELPAPAKRDDKVVSLDARRVPRKIEPLPQTEADVTYPTEWRRPPLEGSDTEK